MVKITFVEQGQRAVSVEAKPGERLLDVAQGAGVTMEGACEGVMACSTCHVILSEDDFERFPEPREEEDDLLDITFGAVPTSRLACQLTLQEAHDGLVVTLPSQTRSLLF
ncbi:MAG: 2Fe-2S iron-sulfur cluster-binding protein [Pseudomonadota bacterium]